MKKIIGIIFVITIALLASFLFKSSAKDKLIECLKISGLEFKGTSQSGDVIGDAFIHLDENGNSCSVEYSILNNTAFEDGKLTNLELKEKKSNGTYLIIGDWEVVGSSLGAKFIFEVFDDEEPNTILCQISGGNWAHYSNLKLSNESFLKIKRILALDKNNLNKKDNWEDYLKNGKTETNLKKEKSNLKVKSMIGIFVNHEYIDEFQDLGYRFQDLEGKEVLFYSAPDNCFLNSGDLEIYKNKKFKLSYIPIEIEANIFVNEITEIDKLE